MVRGGVLSRLEPQLAASTLNESKLIARAVLPESCLTKRPILLIHALPNAVATGTGGAMVTNVVPSYEYSEIRSVPS